MQAVLAVDLGGSSLKACLFALDGAEIASASAPLGFKEDAGGRSEQDPEVWWGAFTQATETIAAGAGQRFRDIAAVSICGFTRTQVLVRAAGDVARPAIGFRDSRASVLAEELLARPEIAAHPQGRHLNAFHPLARLLWLRRSEPQALAAARYVLDPKDFLNLRLTGTVRSDEISQFRLIEAIRGTPSLAQLAGFDRAVLPPLARPEDVVGEVRSGLPGALAALAGARVLAGSHDTFAAVAGLGALKAGGAYCISGSSEVLGLMGEHPREAEGLITIRWGDLWQIGGPGLNGASALDWVVERLGVRDRLDALLAEPANPQPLLFLPFLHGERVPYWDADLRAAFLGLSAAHGPGDLVRAVMEGVAFLNRVVLERAERASGTRAAEVRIGGGGARSATWNQIRADVLGRPVLAAPDGEMGLAGCLALARVGLGIDANLAAAADALPRALARFEPDPARTARHDELFAVFEGALGTITDISHRLTRLGRGQNT